MKNEIIPVFLDSLEKKILRKIKVQQSPINEQTLIIRAEDMAETLADLLVREILKEQ